MLSIKQVITLSTLKPSLLSCAIALFSLPASAVDYSNSFIRDAKADGRIQTIFFNEENTSTKETRGAWTGAVWLNAQSGYLADLFAIGGSAYRVTLLDMKSTNINSSFLLSDNNEGFGKLGQAYLDIKLPENHEDISASLKAGRQMIETGLLRSSTIRSVPSSWEGVNASLGVGEFSGGVAWLNRVNERNAAGFDRILSDGGEIIDWVLGSQLGFSFDLGDARNLKLQYRGGLAKNYVMGHNGVITFSAPVVDSTLTLSGQYYYAKQHGRLWNPVSAAFENDAQSGNINATLSIDSWTFNAGATYTKAQASPNNTQGDFQTIGCYDYLFGANTRGVFDASTSAIFSDFNFDGETAFVLGAQYDFTYPELKGLSLSYNFYVGTGMKVTKLSDLQRFTAHETENDLTVTYTFQQPELKGLEFQMSFVYYTNSEALFLASGQGEQKNFRSYLIYHFSI